MSDNCGTCVFSEALLAKSEGMGMCRRYPPQVDVDFPSMTEKPAARGYWPMVWLDSWCGEHRLRGKQDRSSSRQIFQRMAL